MELLYFLVSEKSASKFHTSNIATSIACTSFLQTESDGFAMNLFANLETVANYLAISFHNLFLCQQSKKKKKYFCKF